MRFSYYNVAKVVLVLSLPLSQNYCASEIAPNQDVSSGEGIQEEAKETYLSEEVTLSHEQATVLGLTTVAGDDSGGGGGSSGGGTTANVYTVIDTTVAKALLDALSHLGLLSGGSSSNGNIFSVIQNAIANSLSSILAANVSTGQTIQICSLSSSGRTCSAVSASIAGAAIRALSNAGLLSGGFGSITGAINSNIANAILAILQQGGGRFVSSGTSSGNPPSGCSSNGGLFGGIGCAIANAAVAIAQGNGRFVSAGSGNACSSGGGIFSALVCALSNNLGSMVSNIRVVSLYDQFDCPSALSVVNQSFIPSTPIGNSDQTCWRGGNAGSGTQPAIESVKVVPMNGGSLLICDTGTDSNYVIRPHLSFFKSKACWVKAGYKAFQCQK